MQILPFLPKFTKIHHFCVHLAYPVDTQKKIPGVKPGIFKTFLKKDYTPFLKRLLHHRTIGEQMHTEE